MKTFIVIVGTVFASGMVFGATFTYDNLLDSTDNWDLSVGRAGRAQIQISGGTASCPSSNWGQAAASTSLTEAIALQNAGDTLSFSFDIITSGTTNAAAMLTFVGRESSLSLGMSEYSGASGAIGYGTSTSTDARAYAFSGSWENGGTTVSKTGNIATAAATATTSISGNIVWQDNQFVLNLSSGSSTASIELGDTFSIDKVVINIDGPNDSTVPSISNLRLEANTVPEPATATLSLLALAGLAVRRRR